ncbi:Alpha/beta hydrolase family protein [Paenibacillus sp. 1_12]|uniref:alpha/beta hydrolase n=1 Tax=Paenibacillus sp. 1_12 TaxID=1566278 RepID=UPI0008DF84C2|nr:alpha/beta hydrolase [Paenibacillus sp. 1_12]SFL73347.1 Alpha/beta hydrolase family protein [Paenibacillus sp. 1_12]
MKLRAPKTIWTVTIVLVLMLAIAAGVYLKPYPPAFAGLEAMRDSSGVKVTDHKDRILFEPSVDMQTDVVLYPGALVRPESYAPLAQLLAHEGFRTWIVKMPLNLAVLGVNRAAEIMEASPERAFVIGGHSLGGVMAARYAVKHAKQLKGVFFLASYPDEAGSLRQAGLPVLSLFGSEDGVLNQTALEQAKAYLPEQTRYVEIAGGNHAQFGSYGPQKGDGNARITAADQWSFTSDQLVRWLQAQMK